MPEDASANLNTIRDDTIMRLGFLVMKRPSDLCNRFVNASSECTR